MKRLFGIIFFGILSTNVMAQSERSDIRNGNSLYKAGKYTESEVKYKQAQGKNPTSYEAAFNLGGALYKQQRYEDAAAGYAKLAEDGIDFERQGNTFFNLGNAQLNIYKHGSGEDKNKRLDEAISSYKEALRRNPSDMQSKFNLAYSQKLKQEQENKDNQDKDKDKNKDQDQNQDQNKDKQDNKDNKDNKDKQDKKDQQDQQQKQDNDRMLKAVQAAEDKTKEKVDQKESQSAGVGVGKQW